MLQYAYKHKGGEHNALVRVLPTNPDGYSHQHLRDIGIKAGLGNYHLIDVTLSKFISFRWIKEVRFYCTSANHSRLIHFKTSNANVLKNTYLGGQHTHWTDWK